MLRISTLLIVVAMLGIDEQQGVYYQARQADMAGRGKIDYAVFRVRPG